jgi:hypothetical protein
VKTRNTDKSASFTDKSASLDDKSAGFSENRRGNFWAVSARNRPIFVENR